MICVLAVGMSFDHLGRVKPQGVIQAMCRKIRLHCWLVRSGGVRFGVGSLGREAQRLTTPKSIRMIRNLAVGIHQDHSKVY